MNERMNGHFANFATTLVVMATFIEILKKIHIYHLHPKSFYMVEKLQKSHMVCVLLEK